MATNGDDAEKRRTDHKVSNVVESLALKDVLVNFSHGTFTDLRNLLRRFAEHDKELRTIELKKHIFRSRKMLCQLLVLLNWLRLQDTRRLFDALAGHQQRLGNLQRFVDFNLDTFFNILGAIFPQLTRRHEVERAFRCHREHTYSELPTEVLNRDKANTLAAVKNEVQFHRKILNWKPADSEFAKLHIALRAKLAYHDRLPRSSGEFHTLQAVIEKGELTVVCGELFILSLTLCTAKSSGSWRPMRFQIISAKDLELSSGALQNLPMTALELSTLEALHGILEVTPDATLAALLRRCQHEAYHLRLLSLIKHFQELHLRSPMNGHLGMPKFSDNHTGTELLVFFWLNEITQAMNFGLRVFLPPFDSKSPTAAPLVVELYGFRAPKTSTLAEERLALYPDYLLLFRETSLSNAKVYLDTRAVAFALITKTTEWLASMKLRFLHQRLQSTNTDKMITMLEQCLTLRLDIDGDIYFSFAVDRDSGRIMTSAHGFGAYLDIISSDLRRVDEELNSVDRDEPIMDQLLALPSDSNGNTVTNVSSIAALKVLLLKLDLILFFKTTLPIAPASPAELMKLSFMTVNANRSSLAFPLRCWDLATDGNAKSKSVTRNYRQRQGTSVLSAFHNSRSAETINESARKKARVESVPSTAVLKVLYLFVLHKEAPSLSFQLYAFLCHVTPDRDTQRLSMQLDHRCLDTKLLTVASVEDRSQAQNEVCAFVHSVGFWARKQFSSLCIPRDLATYLRQKKGRKSFFSDSGLGVVCFETEGIVARLVDSERQLLVQFFTSTEQDKLWGVNKKPPGGSSEVRRLLMDNGLPCPLLFASLRLELCMEAHSDDNKPVTCLLRLVHFELNQSDIGGVSGNSRSALHLSHDVTNRISLQVAHSLISGARLRSGFEFGDLQPFLSALRGTLTLLWLMSHYAFNGCDGLETNCFVRPVSVLPVKKSLKHRQSNEQNECASTDLRLAVCLCDNDEDADQKRKLLELDAFMFAKMSVPQILQLDELDEDDDEIALQRKVVTIVSEKSDAIPMHLPFDEITFDKAFDVLSKIGSYAGFQ